MKFYTSYFDNLKNLPDNIVPISISGKAPDWYTGLQYRNIAPRWWFFSEWLINRDNDFYKKHFTNEVLSKFTPDLLVHKLINKLSMEDIEAKRSICLVCYEKPGDFCHRRIIAEWLENAGYSCTEYV